VRRGKKALEGRKTKQIEKKGRIAESERKLKKEETGKGGKKKSDKRSTIQRGIPKGQKKDKQVEERG